MKRVIAGLVALWIAGAFVPAAHGHFTTGCKHSLCKRHVVRPFIGLIRSIHLCESRNWFLDGRYDGGMQFSPATWSATGSKYRYAWQAPILEQKYRAVVWAHRIGWRWHSTQGWPVCG